MSFDKWLNQHSNQLALIKIGQFFHFDEKNSSPLHYRHVSSHSGSCRQPLGTGPPSQWGPLLSLITATMGLSPGTTATSLLMLSSWNDWALARPPEHRALFLPHSQSTKFKRYHSWRREISWSTGREEKGPKAATSPVRWTERRRSGGSLSSQVWNPTVARPPRPRPTPYILSTFWEQAPPRARGVLPVTCNCKVRPIPYLTFQFCRGPLVLLCAPPKA